MYKRQQQNSSVMIGKRLLLVASDGTGKTFSTALAPNGSVVGWRVEDPLPSNPSGFSLISDIDRSYLLGGYNNGGSVISGVFSISSTIDGLIGVWRMESNLPIALAHHSACLLYTSRCV